MSDQTDLRSPMDRDMDRRLAGWMGAVAPDRAPTRLLEETFARTMTTAQASDVPWRKITIGPRRGSAVTARWILVAVILALAIVVASVAGLGSRTPPEPTASPSPSPSPSATITPPGPSPISVTADVTVPIQGPIAMINDGVDLWVLSSGQLDRIDPTAGKVTATIPLGKTTDLYNAVASGAGSLWATNWDSQVLYRVDPTARKVTATIPVGLTKGVVITPGAVWIANTRTGAVMRLDPATNKIVATIAVGPTGASGPNWLAVGFGSIWVDVPNNDTIARIDPVSGAIQATIRPPLQFTPCGGFGIAADAVWLGDCASSKSVLRIDPATNAPVVAVDLGGTGYNPLLINGSPWITVDRGGPDNGRIVRISPVTNTIDRVLVPDQTFGGGGDIAMIAGSVWVVDGYENTVLRLPLTAFQ